MSVIVWRRSSPVSAPDAAFAAIGFAPIGALALSLTGVVPLHLGGVFIVGTAVVAAVGLSIARPLTGHRAIRGLGAGVLAVSIYDLTRLPFIVFGGWPDFIPKIGEWLLRDPDAHWLVGYGWRYLGNGGGMGMAFMMFAPAIAERIDVRRAGLVFGVAVWSGLLVTWTLTPERSETLFALTPAVLAISLIGHLVYGSVLGQCARRSVPVGEVQPGGRPAARRVVHLPSWSPSRMLKGASSTPPPVQNQASPSRWTS